MSASWNIIDSHSDGERERGIVKVSGRAGSNRRPPRPKRGALPLRYAPYPGVYRLHDRPSLPTYHLDRAVTVAVHPPALADQRSPEWSAGRLSCRVRYFLPAAG